MEGAAVVTGASSGIGEAIARRLLESGCSVVTLQRRSPRLKHKHLQFYPVDLADATETQTTAREVAAEHQVRYLVNNAGVLLPDTLEQITIKDIDYSMALNVRAAMVLIQAFAPAMRMMRFGRIVNISSGAMLGRTQGAVYSSTKAALVGMTRTLCLELASDGITVNAVAPGSVITEMFDRDYPVSSDKRRKLMDSIPVKRAGTPDDIARVVTFLLAPESDYITGQTIFVCGGRSAARSGGT